MIAQQNPPILLDQDGVLADFAEGLYRILKKSLKPELFKLLPDRHNLPTFYVDESVNTGDAELDSILVSAIKNAVNDERIFLDLKPLPGALYYAKMLQEEARKENILVRICTAPHIENRHCHSDKAAWTIANLGIQWAKDMILTHDKTLVQGLLLVDDKETITGCVLPTWQHVVFDTSYNRLAASPLRVSGWSEQTVADILDAALKSKLINLRVL